MHEKYVVIIPTFNRVVHTQKILEELAKYANHVSDILICDSGSTDGTRPIAKKFGAKFLELNQGYYWTGAISCGLQWCSQRSVKNILIINDDISLSADFEINLLENINDLGDGSGVFIPHQVDLRGNSFYGYSQTNRGLKVMSSYDPTADVFAGNGCFVYLHNIDASNIVIPENIYPHYFGDLVLFLILKKLGYFIRVIPTIKVTHTSSTEIFKNENPLNCFFKKRSPFYLKSVICYTWILKAHTKRRSTAVGFLLNQFIMYLYSVKIWLQKKI